VVWVVRALDQVIEWRDKPKAIRCDNGPEYINHALAAWAEKHGIALMFIQPGNLQQNACVERYNRTVRYDWLNQHMFMSVEDAQTSATQWLWTYNNERPRLSTASLRNNLASPCWTVLHCVTVNPTGRP